MYGCAKSVNKKWFVGTCVSIGVGISVKIDGRQTEHTVNSTLPQLSIYIIAV